MDMLLVIKQRLEELGLEQKDLAAGAKVTESYISQLLTRKKSPPAPERTDIYSKMEKSLKLPNGRLARLAELQRKEELKRKVLDPPTPLFKEARKLILGKCTSGKTEQIQAIFERQPFGEIERLVTQKLLMSSKRSPRKNWTMRNGFTFSLASATVVTKRCESISSSFSIRMSSTCRMKIVSRSWTR